MKKIIYDVNRRKKAFYIIINNQKQGFYLTNKIYQTFFDYLQKGVLVDFEVTENSKIIGNEKLFQVNYFKQIISLNPYYVHYDLYLLREEMKNVILNYKNFLFIDFEMTMPGYYNKNFRPEIIQMGYMLTTNGKVKKNSYYILPEETKKLSNRTKRFLKLDEDLFYKEAKHFTVFYKELQDLIKKYNPKIVIWGKNDKTALDHAYNIHNLKPLTDDDSFMDLLKLHKDYFNLKDDLGLFSAHKNYYDENIIQTHDAKDDAFITKRVFEGFLKHIRNA